MASLKDLAQKVKSYFAPKPLVSPVPWTQGGPATQYAQPSFGQKVQAKIFGGKFGETLAGVRPLPKFDLQSVLGTQRIQNPALRFGAQALTSIPESVVNIPSQLGQGVINVGSDVGQMARGSQPWNAGRLSSSAAPFAEGMLNIATLGPGGMAAKGVKNIVLQTGKQGVKQAIKTGAIGGAKFGATQGFLSQLGQQRDTGIKPLELVRATATGGAGGAVLGGTLAGGVKIVGGTINKVSNVYKNWGVTPEVSKKLTQEHFIDTPNTKLTPKQVKKQTLDEINVILGRPKGTLVYMDDMKSAINKKLGLPDTKIGTGLQAKPKGGMEAVMKAEESKGLTPEVNPLIAEAKKYKSAEEFIKAQPKLFRGGSPLDLSKSTKEGISFAKDVNTANRFNQGLFGSGEGLRGYVVDKNAKILKLEDIPTSLVKKFETDETALTDYVLKKGFDGVDIANKYGENEVRIFNPKVIKKEYSNLSELTGIYNQAQSGLTPEVTTPIAKPQIETVKPTKLARIGQEPTLKVPKVSRLGISSEDILTPPATGIGRRAPQEINVSNLGINKKQKIELQKQTANTVKQTLSNDEIKRIAEGAGFDTRTYTTEQTAQKIAEQLNVRRQVVELENQLSALRKAKAKPEVIATQLKKIADQAEITTKQGTDIARQLQARRILANEIDTPMQKMFKVLDEAGVNRDVYVKKAAQEGIDFNNPQQALKYYRELVPAKAKDWVDLVRYNSMLSSPNTFINNLSSNLQGTGIVAPIEKTVTGLIDKLYSGITGKPRQYFTGEGAAYAKGYYSNLQKAGKSFMDVMRGTDTELGSALDVRQAPLATTGTEKRIYEHLGYPMKLLEGTDKFFRTLTSGGVEEAMKYKIGKGIKLKMNVEDLALQEAKKRLFISELGQNEGSKALDAIDFFANLVQRAKGSKNPIVSNLAKFTLPFVRTPTNILKQGLEYSPLGATTMWGSQHKMEQVAKSLMGTAVGLAAATLVANDHITWAEPTSEKQRNAFRAAGMQPYAVKIGNNWVSYAKLHPAVSFPLAMVAAIKNAQDNKRLTESEADTVLNGLSKWVNFFVDQSYVKSIGDMVSGLKGSAEDLSRIPSNYASQMIPWRALGSWITRLIDPVQRKADPDGSILDKQLQQISAQLPLFSYGVPARLDQVGQPIKNTNTLLNAFSPVGKITTESPEMKQQYLDIVEKSKLTKQKADLKTMLEKGQNVTGLEVQAAEVAPVGMTKDQADIAKLRFDLSGEQAQKVSDTLFFLRTDAGTIDTIDISKEIPEPKYSGNEAMDKKRKSAYKTKLSTRGSDIVKLVDSGLLTEEQGQALMDEIEIKYDSTLKGKKPKKITIKSTKINLPKLSTTKMSKPKTVKIPAFKGTKTKRYKPRSIKIATRKAKKIKVRGIKNTLSNATRLA